MSVLQHFYYIKEPDPLSSLALFPLLFNVCEILVSGFIVYLPDHHSVSVRSSDMLLSDTKHAAWTTKTPPHHLMASLNSMGHKWEDPAEKHKADWSNFMQVSVSQGQGRKIWHPLSIWQHSLMSSWFPCHWVASFFFVLLSGTPGFSWWPGCGFIECPFPSEGCQTNY